MSTPFRALATSIPPSARSLQLRNPATPYILASRYSTAVLPERPGAFKRAAKLARYTGYFCLSSVFGVFALGAGIFIHDAFTYTDKHVDRVPLSPLALHPESGGPKNLPIVRVQADDQDDEENQKMGDKPKLVIVGGGWGVRLSSPLLPLLWPYGNIGNGYPSNFASRRLPRHGRVG